MSPTLHIWQPTQVAVSPFLLGSSSVLTLSGWGSVAMQAALMVGNGLALPASYQSAPSVIIATFDYCYLIFAILLGFLLISEIPDRQTSSAYS